ncbi:morphogenic membrane protein MmpB [Streptomyces sp. NPDC060194]
MLWSDPENEPPEELRETQAMLRRAGILVAVAMVLVMLVLGVH